MSDKSQEKSKQITVHFVTKKNKEKMYKKNAERKEENTLRKNV